MSQSNIIIKEPPEPNSRAAILNLDLPVLIGSGALRQLVYQLRGYCEGRHEGRSILIAGHRGAGKTTLVHAALREVLSAVEDAGGNGFETAFGAPDRPMLVLLQGPALLPEEVTPNPPLTKSAGTQAGVSRTKSKLSGDGEEPDASASREDTAPTSPADIALNEITLVLYRAAANEFIRRFKERTVLPAEELFQRAPLDAAAAGRLQRARALAAQFELDLDEFPGQARIAYFWKQSCEFIPPSEAQQVRMPSTNRAEAELLALLSLCEARRRVAGKLSSETRDTGTNDRKSQGSVGLELKGEDFFKSLAALLAGGAVSTALHVSETATGPAAILAGLIATVGALGVFKLSSSWSRSRTFAQKELFIPNRTAATLEQVIPVLIQRLRGAGIAPVFLVDELDKVDHLERRFGPLIGRLKKLVAERAFFCFIADRSYFEILRSGSVSRSYSREYTYFTHHLFVAYSPADYHEYLHNILGLSPDEPMPADGLPPPSNGPAPAVPVPAANPPANASPSSPNDGKQGDSTPPANGLAAKGSPPPNDAPAPQPIPALPTAVAPPRTPAGVAAPSPNSAAALLAVAPDPGAKERENAATEREYAQAFKYLLLHAAQLHPIDLRRELARHRDSDGRFNLSVAEARSNAGYRLEILIQLAVEYVLESSELAGEMERDPSFRRLAHDALYYPSRQWELGKDLDLGVTGREKFQEYILERMQSELEAERSRAGNGDPNVNEDPAKQPQRAGFAGTDWDKRVSVRQSQLLWDSLCRLANLLTEPQASKSDDPPWVETDRKWRDLMRAKREREGSVMEAASTAFLLHGGVERRFQWQYDRLGRDLRPATEHGSRVVVGAAFRSRQWEEDVNTIRDFEAALEDMDEPGLGLQTLADDFRLLSTAPAYSEAATAMRRLEGEGKDARNLEQLDRDAGLVETYAQMLKEHVNCLGAGLYCARVLAHLSFQPETAKRMADALQAVRNVLRLDNKSAADTEKQLTSICTTIESNPKWPQPKTPSEELFKARELDRWLDEAIGAIDVTVTARDQVNPFVETAARDAWGYWARHFGGEPDARLSDGDTIALLICEIAQAGPGHFLRLNFKKMSFMDWSRACAAALLSQVSQSPSPFVPRWVLWPALKALGFGVHERTAQAVISSLGPAKGDVTSATVDEHEIIKRCISAADRGLRVAIIARDSGSMFIPWSAEGDGVGAAWSCRHALELARGLSNQRTLEILKPLFAFDVLVVEEGIPDADADVIYAFISQLARGREGDRPLAQVIVLWEKPATPPSQPFVVRPARLREITTVARHSRYKH